MSFEFNCNADPLIFEKLLQPIDDVLEEFDQHPISQAAQKLKFRLFVRLLLYRVFAQLTTLRDLQRDVQSSLTSQWLGFPVVGLSTLHDAFARYPVAWLTKITHQLMSQVKLEEIPELAALGKLWCVDSSLWPVVRQLSWMRHQEWVEGVRLHLGLSLNTLCPAMFLMTTDRSPTETERASLIEMVEAGVTYITDRGYVDLKLYLTIWAKQAFFVIRERNTIQYHTFGPLAVCLNPAYGFVSDVRDQVILLDRDPFGTLFRLVHFVVAGHRFHLITNRFDLTTQQVIWLYAWRWQVELIFRAWKHTLGFLHLINLSESGLEIQFYVLLIASVLWVVFHQEVARAATSPATPSNTPKREVSITPTGIFSHMFQVAWRLSKPLVQFVKNCLARPWSFYLHKFSELRL